MPVHAFTDDALGDLDAVGVAARIAAREISAAEAAEAAVARLRAVDPALGALVVECYDRGLALANGPVRPGPFAGVPALVKDNVDLAGLPTCYGSAAFTPHPARRHAAPVAQLLAQGVVVLGKTAMPEFGLAASTEYAGRPPARNPWNPGHSVGGSSGGSGALVAAGAVPLAHGNDGGGSIRIPASANGLVGLKPSRGRLRDQAGAGQLPVNIAAEGALVRSVRDAAHHLAAMERTYRNTALPAVGLVEGPAGRRLRIGVVTDSVIDATTDPSIVANVRAAADLLADLGHDVTDATMPVGPGFVDDFRLYWSFFASALTANSTVGHRLAFDPRRLDPFTKALARWGLRNAHRWPAAFRRLRGVAATGADGFTGIDVLLTPVTGRPAPPLGYLDPTLPFEEFFGRTIAFASFTALQNVTGSPAIAVPFGMLDAGLPGAIHLAARPGDERTVLELAYEIEAARPLPRIQG